MIGGARPTTRNTRAALTSLMLALTTGLGALASASCSPQRWDLEVMVPSSSGGAAGKGAAGAGMGGSGRGGREGPGPGPASGGSSGPDGGKDCSTWTQLSQRGKPRVLLMVDRSSNTLGSPGGGENDMPWWKLENEALSSVVSSFGNVMNLGYRPFPTGTACMMSGEPWNPWENDVPAQIGACANGSCVSSSDQVPLVSALNDARKNFWPPGPSTDALGFMVVLVGSTATCVNACQVMNPLVSVALAGIEPFFNPFGNGLEGNQCLNFDNAPLARNGRELTTNLTMQFKQIASQAFCSFQLSTGPGVTFNTVRVVVNNMTYELPRDYEKGWNFERNDVRIFGPACRAIVEAATMSKATVSATVLDATCRH